MPPHLLTPFAEIALLLALAAAMGLVGTLFRQPLIVSFIAVGLVAGPSVLDVLRSGAQIGLLSELGLVVLLFLVGIKLDVKLIRSLGAVAVATGLGQVTLTAALGWLVGLALGLEALASLYLGVALAFSSTIIIVKLLSDKREIDALHGQIALGVLIVQDLVVVLAMIVLSAVGIGAGNAHGGGSVPGVLASGVALVGAVVLFVRHLANPLTEWLARVPELLVIFAIALAAVVAALGDLAGLGKEVGGLLAGVALASTPYRETIAARLAPLRDFLLLFFFIALGATLDLSLLGAHVTGAVVFSAFVLIGKPLIVMGLMRLMGYGKRTAFLAGLTLAQISEFSLIFVAMGVSLGHLGDEVLGLLTMVGLVTIAVSTYLITLSHRLYALCEPLLGWFDRPGSPRDALPDSGGQPADHRVIVLGLGRYGAAIGLRLQRRGIQPLGVDFNPQAVRRWRALGMDAVFGDVTDPEFLTDLPLGGAQWLVMTVPSLPTGLSHEDPRSTLVQVLKAAGLRGRIAVTSHSAADTEALRDAGADLVLEPFQDAADRAVEILCGAAIEERVEIPQIEVTPSETWGADNSEERA